VRVLGRRALQSGSCAFESVDSCYQGMSAQGRSPLLRLALVIIALMLAAGSGLGGLVSAFAPVVHVCTCSSGGSHSACPVCNPRLSTHPRSPEPAVEGRPCGDGRYAVAAVGEPGILPMLRVELVPPFVRAAPPCDEDIRTDERTIEPSTPPPRIALI
jgi:hypothetical protein